MDLLSSLKAIKDPAKAGPPPIRVTAVIVAAGRSERIGGVVSKQFIPLCRIPVLARTLSVFEACRTVQKVIVVTRPEDLIPVADIVREFGFTKVVRIVRGGATRQESAAAGFTAAEDAEYVAVHDGARPLLTAECIDRVIAAAREHGAAAAAVRLKDTVKLADADGNVAETPDRGRLWAVQTPQVFEAGLYAKALAQAQAAGADYTDDCQLIEAAGGRVRLVEGEYTNLKITTKDDVTIAEAIIRSRGEKC